MKASSGSWFEGAILGSAIGDALGFPTEFLLLEQIHDRFGTDGVTGLESVGRHPRGTSTDDTQVGIAGAMSDAHNGLDAIPKRWRREVENATYLRDLANRLSDAIQIK